MYDIVCTSYYLLARTCGINEVFPRSPVRFLVGNPAACLPGTTRDRLKLKTIIRCYCTFSGSIYDQSNGQRVCTMISSNERHRSVRDPGEYLRNISILDRFCGRKLYLRELVHTQYGPPPLRLRPKLILSGTVTFAFCCMSLTKPSTISTSLTFSCRNTHESPLQQPSF